MPEPEYSRTNREKVFGKPGSTTADENIDEENPGHAGVLRAFAGAVLRGEPLIADGREGINGLTISNAMHLSAWTGKEVTIPFDEELFFSELSKRIASSRAKSGGSSVTGDTEGTY